MNSGIIRAGLVALILMSAPVFGQTLDEVERAIIEASGKIQSYTVDVKTVMDFSTSDMTMGTTTTGTTEFMRDGDKVFYRSDNASSMTTVAGNQEMKIDSKTLIISDGEFLYTVEEKMGQKMAVKSKLYSKQFDVPHAGIVKAHAGMFEREAAAGAVKVAPSQQVDGQDCYVIVFTPNLSGGSTTYYFSKVTGMMMKTVMLNGEGKEMMTTTMTNWKMNPNLDASRFKFTAPPGVTVIDMTNMEFGPVR